MCNQCRDGMMLDQLGQVATLSSGEPLYCIECAEGIEYELARLAKRLQDFAAGIARMDAVVRLERRAFRPWEARSYAHLCESFAALTRQHDALEHKLAKLQHRQAVAA